MEQQQLMVVREKLDCKAAAELMVLILADMGCWLEGISINGSALNSCFLERVSFKPLISWGPRQDEAKVPECLTKAKHCRAGFHILVKVDFRSGFAEGVVGCRNTEFMAA
jgi:hypothetical protein